jgi:hypothetical protein
MRRLVVVASAIALSATLGSSVLAQGKGKGKGKGTADSASLTFSLVLENDADGDGIVSWGDTINFQVQTSETDRPQVSVTCYQNEVLVASSMTWPNPTTLYSRAWQGGAADCVAELFYYSSPRNVVIATLSVPVAE